MKYWIFALVIFAGIANASPIHYETSLLQIHDNGDGADYFGNGSVSFDYDTGKMLSLSLSTDRYSITLVDSGPMNEDVIPGYTYNIWMLITAAVTDHSTGQSFNLSGHLTTDLIGTTAPSPREGFFGAPGIFFYIYLRDLSEDESLDIVISAKKTPPVSADVPEPTTLALLGLGLAGLVRLRRQQLPNLV